ncbi:MAG: RHS repeat domain-containing protein, partial [Pirellula sp.]
TGREWDATLGLHHFRARWMSPSVGRFLGRDPIGFEGSEWGLYHFGNASALNALDPSGLDCLASCNQAKRRSERQCCQAAKAIPNFDGGNRGLTFCCDGRVVTCVWSNRVNDDFGNLNAKRIILNCIHKHEENHVPDIRPCPDICPDLRYGEPVDGYTVPMSECLALKRHIRCLIPGLRSCGNDLECKEEVSREITEIFNNMKRWCDAADIKGGVPGVYE